MKITVLDGHGLNPGDVSWDGIKAFAEQFTVYDRSPQELVVERIGDSEIILLNKVHITKEIVERCPNLRYIGVLATGFNVIDTVACRERGIIVTNIPSYSTNAVAQHVFSFILHFTNQVASHSVSVHNGGWISNPDFCYWLSPLTELNGKTLGIYGFGHIGQKVAEIAHSFGMKIIVHAHSAESFEKAKKNLPFDSSDIKMVSVEELFKESDFLSLHAPLTPETQSLVNSKTLSLMKKSAYLINTARGGMICEKELRQALDSGTIAGYATDVLLEEPMNETCPLYKAPNCVITPHLAWAPKETRLRLLDIEIENIKAFLAGKPINVVN
ncbi:MAG: D-2-hydroxyacid dehydrogenase [Treponema sp.]|uniref:D-2-hydroxyacid dehydrogenase n=1 Tax=Treponema sp. TaxID=166 RepID=UPI0025F60C1A|nr:D-2-hydroxyacid dehydrogenase [Treponema sp.]MBQ9624042.1 D-2-hydroxyacid dehydrogenase [Treponema sp.]MBR0497281.1 D-2-hydroxyacid dehydrogenase [Treponema sp.]